MYDLSYDAQDELRNYVVPAPPGVRQAFAMTDMIEQRREAFRTWVREQGGVRQVAQRAGIPPTTLYSYLTGKSQSLKGSTQEEIARAFGISQDELFGADGSPATVPVVGYVQAGAQAILYAEGQGPFDHVPAPEGATRQTVAVQIRGESLGEFFTEWLVFYDDVRSPITPDMHGQLCVVGLPDQRILVKLLKPARDPGRFHLLSQTEGPILDQEVAWGAKVKSMSPRH